MHRMMRWLHDHAWAGDSTLVVALAAPGLFAAPAGSPRWTASAMVAGLTLPLLARRRLPGTMTSVALTSAWAGLLAGVWQHRLPLAHLALEIMLYTLVVRGSRRQAVLATAATVAFFTLWALRSYPGADAGWSAAGYCLSVVTAWSIAEYVRARRAYLAEVERRAQFADAERHALARAAIAEERARIARELHDVLAHHVGVMVVNAEGARLMREADPAVVDRTLDVVSTTGRTALKDLRRLLQALHTGEPTDASTTEDDLRRLVRQAAGGRPGFGLRITGTGSTVPANVMTQVYRIVQEGLTNVVKHAGVRARVDTTVDFGTSGRRRTIRIEMCNSAGSRQPHTDVLPSSGRGLAGIHERAAMFGGTVQAAPAPAGGYRLVVTLPLVEHKFSQRTHSHTVPSSTHAGPSTPHRPGL